jgi:hypothetical protein
MFSNIPLSAVAKSWVICSIGLYLFLVSGLAKTCLRDSHRKTVYLLFTVIKTLVHISGGYGMAILAVLWIAPWHRIATSSDPVPSSRLIEDSLVFFILPSIMISLSSREVLEVKEQLDFLADVEQQRVSLIEPVLAARGTEEGKRNPPSVIKKEQ